MEGEYHARDSELLAGWRKAGGVQLASALS